tara:strand:+ start:527 stop:733 length:207 start_codon:yes stop_codon:yes gene_type:complete
MKLTYREKELINGMIEVQMNHAARCTHIRSKVAIIQKQRIGRCLGNSCCQDDLERVELLKKILIESEK